MTRKRIKPKPVTDPNAIEVFDEGTLSIVVKAEGKPDKKIEADLLPMQLACEKCQLAHKLELRDDYYVPTRAFLEELAKEFSEVTGAKIKPTVAYQLWPVVNARWFRLKKNMNGTPS